MDSPSKNQHTNPIEENRHSTDKFFIFIFLLFFTAWLAMGASAIYFNKERVDGSNAFPLLKNSAQLIRLRINTPLIRVSAEFAMSLVSTIGLLVLFVYLIEKFTKTFMCFAMGVYVLHTAYSIFKSVSNVIDGSGVNETLIENMLRSLFCLITMIIGFASICKSGMNDPRDIIKNSCRIILESPSIIVFSGLSVILQEIVVLFSVNGEINGTLSEHNKSLVLVLRICNVLGCCMTLVFISNFTLMVISEYSINHYWKNHEKPHFGQCIATALRYHVGTVMFSSIMPISLICAIVQAFKHKPLWDRKENYIWYIISKIDLTLSMSPTASIFSIIYGTNFIKSSQKTFNTMLRRCVLYLATIWIIDTLNGIMIRAFDVVLQEVDGKMKTDEDLLTFYLALKGIEYPAVCFLSLISMCSKALLVNQIIIMNKEN